MAKSKSKSKFSELYKNATVPAKIGFIVILIWIITAITAQWIAPYDPTFTEVTSRLIPPSFCNEGSSLHILGTDEVGRDILSRLIYGSRISLIVAIMAGLLSCIIGTTFGLLAGYFGGKIDTVLMRIVDVMLAFPFMFMALCFMVVLGSGLTNIIVVLGITGWVPYARTIRAEVLSIKTREFVISSETIGCSSARVIFTHILPNVLDSAIVIATMQMATTILSEAALTFLGMGLPADIPSWGQMISSGRSYIYLSWWLTTIPGIAIFLVCLSINFVGDWLRDMRDPRLRGAIEDL